MKGLDGLEVVLEGDVAKVSDDTERLSVADSYESKYGERFTAPEAAWFGLGDSIRKDEVLLYRVAPARAFGFAKGGPFSQARWEFS